MSSLIYWSMVVIFYQTIICIIISWMTLSCKFCPTETEFHEVTLIKLLYLYDPEACGRVYFYNYTFNSPLHMSSIVWPVKNNVAAEFRNKIRCWLSMHVMWALLGLIYISQLQRPCGLYATLLPFTLVGAANLIMDITFTAMFLMEVNSTSTEAKIISYINSNTEDVRAVTNAQHQPTLATTTNAQVRWEPDTSWISLLMAYVSCRAVVQWAINFWLVKDNYCEGIEIYHKMRKSILRLQQIEEDKTMY